ncbi:hypothetical protein QR680_016277 [Steinernema hermaphroditum]|uniref:Sulfotransferase domain-containing protein n=1 Tax=Steinernema hermaphroditum TaxID=289476 RepID=A0AA39HAN9_9BILA|nr:hypothetical protein QR680_016277 [Steinernema hermaphroditum]
MNIRYQPIARITLHTSSGAPSHFNVAVRRQSSPRLLYAILTASVLLYILITISCLRSKILFTCHSKNCEKRGPTLFDSIMTKYEDVFVFGRPVGEEEKELDEKLLNHSLIYKESLSEASDILQLHPQNEIIPPFVELEDKMRVVHKKKLAACVIEKNMSTVLTAILCFLEDFKVFTQANRTIATEGYYGRFCQEKNEYNSVEHMLATTHTHLNDWTMFVLVRDPLERLVSAYADKCIYHREKQIEDNCYGCRHNVTCFVSNVYSRSKAFAESSPENRTYTMEDVHVFPQNWCVSF